MTTKKHTEMIQMIVLLRWRCCSMYDSLLLVSELAPQLLCDMGKGIIRAL